MLLRGFVGFEFGLFTAWVWNLGFDCCFVFGVLSDAGFIGSFGCDACIVVLICAFYFGVILLQGVLV